MVAFSFPFEVFPRPSSFNQYQDACLFSERSYGSKKVVNIENIKYLLRARTSQTFSGARTTLNILVLREAQNIDLYL